ncbi:MAG: thioredoxin family protein [Betaproteobacteria bacterium]|nr:thioredoxin family protein [Betaproteobacteria bacterium]
MRIELFQVPGCARCDSAKAELQCIAETHGVEWSEVNALNELDRAVDLGVLTLPALVIDGVLAFAALPTPAALRQELKRREGDD